jgi:hypothetical protein
MRLKLITAVSALLLCTSVVFAQGVDCGKGNDFKNHGKANPSCGNGSNSSGNGGSGGASSSTSTSTSSVSNSGNSSNTNVNVAEGGTASQGQKQTQGQVQGQNQSNSLTNSNTATNQGNNSTQSTAFNQVRQTASAIAPDTFPTSPCFKTASGAGQGAGFGFSLGAGKVDEGCDARETARILASMGSKTAACKLIVSTKASKRAGVTLADCLIDSTPEQLQPVPSVVIVPPANVSVTLPKANQ